MLALNDKQIDLRSKTDPYAKKIQDWWEKMKEISNNDIRLTFTDTYKTPPNTETQQMAETAQEVGLPTEVVLLENDEKWNYFTKRKRKNNEEFIYEPKNFSFKEMHFNDEYADIGLAYFLIVLSPYCEKIPGVKDPLLKQNVKNLQKVYKVEMPVYDADNKLFVRRYKTKTENQILNSMTADQIKLVGYAMRMNNLDILTDSQLRNTVIDYVTSTKDLMDEFWERCEYKPKNDMDANIHKAIEQGVIVLQKPRGIHRWHFSNPDGKGWGDLICEVTPGINDRDFLAKYLGEHDDVYQVIKSKLY